MIPAPVQELENKETLVTEEAQNLFRCVLVRGHTLSVTLLCQCFSNCTREKTSFSKSHLARNLYYRRAGALP